MKVVPDQPGAREGVRQTLYGARELEPLLRPHSIAVIGASDDASRIGGRPIAYLRSAGFTGAIYPVNPRYRSVQQLRCYPTVGSIQQGIDLAIVAVPASAVPDVLEQCVAAGVRSAIIFSGGFSEIGDAGQALQSRVIEIVKRTEMKVLGPNCLGVISEAGTIPATFSASLAFSEVVAGRVGVVSQSGAFASHCNVLASRRGVGLSHWITTGNECDVDAADAVNFLAADPATGVIALYLEGVRNGDRMRRALHAASAAGKPVVVLKAGTSEVGAEAAKSHTGALVGSDQVYDALIREVGATRVYTVDEFVDLLYALDRSPLPSGGRTAIMTVSGGIGILMADAASEMGLEVTPFPIERQQRLQAAWPSTSTTNPLDTTAQILNSPQMYSDFVSEIEASGTYDIALQFLSHIGLDERVAAEMKSKVSSSGRNGRVINMISMLATDESRALFEQSGYLVFEDPTAMTRTAGALSRCASNLKRVRSPYPILTRPTRFDDHGMSPGGLLNEADSQAFLHSVGVPVTEFSVASNEDEAYLSAARLGCPVSMKIVSPDIAHKTDVGGVRLNIAPDLGVKVAFAEIYAAVREAMPEARLEGVLVSPMITDGVEVFIGTSIDAVFGPVVAFGSGGTEIELINDVAMRIAPFDVESAHELIRETVAFKRLTGHRGAREKDVDAVARLLSELSQVAYDHRSTISSIEINPLLVRDRGDGVVAIDGLVATAPKAADGHVVGDGDVGAVERQDRAAVRGEQVGHP